MPLDSSKHQKNMIHRCIHYNNALSSRIPLDFSYIHPLNLLHPIKYCQFHCFWILLSKIFLYEKLEVHQVESEDSRHIFKFLIDLHITNCRSYKAIHAPRFKLI